MKSENSPFLITERLEFSLLAGSDQGALQELLGDPDIMYAWEHGFSSEEVQDWLSENLRRYASDGYSYWAVRLRSDGSLIGVMGILQERVAGEAYTGIGYILHKRCWGQGYASEGGEALCQYAFHNLELPLLTAQVRTNNLPSQRVAAGLGMLALREFKKLYCGQEMPHLLYCLERDTWQRRAAKRKVIMQINEGKKRFLPLLLLGDEEETMIDRYLERGELFALYDGDLKAVAVVTREAETVFELKNLAVEPKAQRQGYGHYLIEVLCGLYGREGNKMLVGTGDVPSALDFYAASGFVRSHIVKNFFTDNYPLPIFEGSTQLVDMVYLERKL